MKKIRVENGKIVAYIEKRDVEILAKTKEVVPKSFFEEEAVRNMCPDENGLFRIENMYNVYFIRDAKFIPNQDRLEKSSLEELTHDLKQAEEKKQVFEQLVNILYARQKLTLEQKELLDNYDVVSPKIRKEIEKTAFVQDDEPTQIKFCTLVEMAMLQARLYSHTMLDYLYNRKEDEANKKKQQEQEEITREEIELFEQSVRPSVFSLKKILKRKFF